MAQILSFRFRSPGQSNWTTATVTNPEPEAEPPTDGSVAIPGMTCPIPALSALRTAARELLDQPVDGVTDTKKIVDGTGIVLELAEDRSTLKFGALGTAQPREKAEDFLGGLEEFGLVAAP